MTNKQINEIKISVLKDLYNILKSSQHAFDEDCIIGHLFVENLKLKIEEYEMTDKKSYCTVENDGVAVCVCKYRPCEKLKRKEQECEEKERYINLLKKCLDDSFKRQEDNELYWEKENKTLKQKFKEKEQECEQYKKEINRLNKIGYCYAYEKDCHEICKQQNCIIKNGYKYKQTLEEIEEFCLVYRENPVEGTAYDKILNIIDKAKEK